MRWKVLPMIALLFGVTACASDIPEGASQAYREGYNQGCREGYVSGGWPGYYYYHDPDDLGIADYAAGREDAFQKCYIEAINQPRNGVGPGG